MGEQFALPFINNLIIMIERKLVIYLAVNKYKTSDAVSTYDGVGDDDEILGVLKTNLNGIFGIPYQFMESVDQRIDGTEIGAKYAEKIVARMPLLFITPCRQVFMKGFDGTSKEIALGALLDGNSEMMNSITSVGKYYTTEFAYSEYYNYVNTMATQLSCFAGIGNEQVNINGSRKKIKNINWQDAKNSSFKNYFAADEAIVFYLDGLTSMSESFSNATTESSLASTINGFSDQANELKFLIGKDSALSNLMEGATSITDSIGSALSGTLSSLTGGMLGDLAKTGVSTVLTGGKIIFPKIWQDSSFSRSYSFDVKLRSPDHDSMSIFMNVLIPYIHLLGAVLPVGIDDNPNGYTSPFLVKAYCKGMFNIDMGIITDLSVTRGAECQWNDDGLPTQIDVSITIEDLYSSLFMSDEKKSNLAVIKNTAMMDFLSNMAGLNVADTEIGRRTKMLAYLTTSDLTRTPSNIWNKFDTKISNLMSGLYRNL